MKKLLALIAFCLAFSGVAYAQQARIGTHYGTSMQWGGFAIGDGTCDFVYTVYRLSVDNVQAGDTFDISTDGQVRNDTGWNVEVARWISVNAGDTAPSSFINGVAGYDGKVGGTQNGSEPPQGMNGRNSTPSAHYELLLKEWTYIAPQAYGRLWFSLRVRMRTSAVSGCAGNANLVAQNHQGHLIVRHYR